MASRKQWGIVCEIAIDVIDVMLLIRILQNANL